MTSIKSFKQKLLQADSNNFESLALEAFKYQASNNPIYEKYLKLLSINVSNVKSIAEIPFLPISFFKTQQIKTGYWEEQIIFKSSGTTGSVRSKHYTQDLEWYKRVSKTCFEQVYGPVEDYTIFALLPSYLEREGSSLIYMVEHFIQLADKHSGFFLNEYEQLIDKIQQAQQQHKKILLIGVSFALLELAENYSVNLRDSIVMETGGMKGRRKEMIRKDLHAILRNSFQVECIHSEYGMTELMSQAYASKNGQFLESPFIKILLRDLNDPFDVGRVRSGGINIIDLANIHSCCFIETQDMGLKNDDDTFEVLGRVDNSEIRGCNLLIT